MQLQDVDPRAGQQFADWFAVVDAAVTHDRPGETGWLPQQLRESALAGRPHEDGSPPPDELVEVLAVVDAGQTVGAALSELPLTDNTHVASLELWVLPQTRRRGVATLLLEELTGRAQAAGRTTQMTELDEPPALAGRSPGRAFGERHGFALALDEVRRDLRLPVDPARLDTLEAGCAPYARGYRISTWRDRVPDELLGDRAELARQMSTDAPLGDLSWHEEAWDGGRVRRREQLLARQGRAMLGGGAVHEESGVLVAFTEMAVPLAAPDRVHQWETLVVGAHRGHRLGTLVKTAVVRRLAGEFPTARTLSTSNARSNGPMIAVNEALGFVPNGTIGTWERALQITEDPG